MSIRPNRRGVTPVIGNILMVALVVVIAAVLSVMVLAIAEDLEDTSAPVTYGDNLIENPDFEQGGTHWKEYDDDEADWVTVSDEKIVDGDGVGGSKALQLESDEYVEQNLDAVLLPEAEYRLCADSRLDSQDGGQAWIGVQHATGGPENHLTVWEVTWDNYHTQCEYFETDSQLENITVWVYTSDESVTVTTDDFVLQRTQFLADGR